MSLSAIPRGAFAPSPYPAERWLKRAFYLACAALAGWLLWRAAYPQRPFEADWVNKELGRWSLRFLFVCLLLSPLSRLLRRPAWRRWRRPLGLMAFAFAAIHTVHFLLYGRIWPHRMAIVVQRPYLAIGLVALILFAPLAATSNDAVVRWMTPRRWRLLHGAVYPAAALSVVHEVMAYARLIGEAGLYCALVVLLLAAKAWRETGAGRGRAAPPVSKIRDSIAVG